jgi:hypothetical protein
MHSTLNLSDMYFEDVEKEWIKPIFNNSAPTMMQLNPSIPAELYQNVIDPKTYFSHQQQLLQ